MGTQEVRIVDLGSALVNYHALLFTTEPSLILIGLN